MKCYVFCVAFVVVTWLLGGTEGTGLTIVKFLIVLLACAVISSSILPLMAFSSSYKQTNSDSHTLQIANHFYTFVMYPYIASYSYSYIQVPYTQ